ncbi:MAG: formate dehydrogenase subunit gamma [bacterium]|jgi:formate dehydrogenase subunit gamma
MRHLFAALGRIGQAAALSLALLVATGVNVGAQQPNSVNPTASAVTEDQLFRQLNPTVAGRITIPDDKAGILIQPAGRDWRSFHQVTQAWIGAIAILGMGAVILTFYFVRGRIPIGAGPSGKRILRFNSFERFVHWMTAGCFIVLGVTGLNITFGKALILPLLGYEAFAFISQMGKYAHNFLAFPFMLGLVFMFAVWVKDNIPNAVDVAWFKAGGGLVGSGHPPARKFNGGQKLIFWSVIVGGVALSISGVILLFPFVGTTIADMQLAQMVHGAVSLVLVGVMIAHIYIGSVGMEGAFDAMGSGEVDLNWAKEHHSLWVAEVDAKGGRAAQPAE